ncbi:hypothetical protein [Micromonospora sp. NPDC023814]|uniref:hypothetical protein n=1 Tax=Micromonospora sp. NPDC023814 TaxID=3154596 RepID=UPI0033E8406B
MPAINVSLPDTAEVWAAEAVAAIEHVGGDDGPGAESSGSPPGLQVESVGAPATEDPVDADGALGAIGKAARLLGDLHPLLHGGDVRGGGAGRRLRLRLATGEPVLGTDTVDIPIELVNQISVDVEPNRVVVLRSDQFSPVLEIGVTADVDRIRVQLSGEIAAWLVRRAQPEATASPHPQATSSHQWRAAVDAARDEWETVTSHLLTFRRTDHLSWLAWLTPTRWAQAVRLRPGPPAKLPTLPVFDDVPLSLHLVRRIAPAVAAMPTTYVSGTWAQRSPALIANSIASTAIQATVQSFMDWTVDVLRRKPEARNVLLAADHDTPDSPFEAPSWHWSKLWGYAGKRVPANTLAAAISWALLTSMAGRFESGGISFALIFGSTLLGQTAVDAVEGRPAGTARARYRHDLERSADFARNEFIRSAYYQIRELAARTGGQLPADLAPDLLDARAVLAGMRDPVGAEVAVQMAEMHSRRGLRFGYGTPNDLTFDLTRRGLPPGEGPTWHNALRMGLRDGIGQLPSVVLAFALSSAIPLVSTNALATVVSGAVYGFGERRASHVTVADSGVAASWDTRYRIEQIIRWIDHLTDPAANPAPTGGFDVADPNHFPILGDAPFARVTGVWAQYRRNRQAGRPPEVSGWNQMTYKHLPSLVARMVVTAIVGPLLGLPGRLVGLLLASALVSGLLTAAENAIRQAWPVLEQLAADQAATRQARRDPQTVSELADSVVTLIQRATAADNAIVPHIVRLPSSHSRRAAGSADLASRARDSVSDSEPTPPARDHSATTGALASIEPGRDTSPTVGAAPATGHDLAASTELSSVRTSPPAELEASTDPLAATPPVVATEDPTNTQPEALTNPSTRATPQPGLEVAPSRPINTEPEPPAKGSLATSPDPEPDLLTATPTEFLTGRPAHTPPEPGTSPSPADRSRRPTERPSDAESPSVRARQWLQRTVAPRVSRPLSKAAFVDLMNQVVRDTPPEVLGAEPCLVLAERARVELYDRRSASRKHVDDLGVGTGTGRIALGAGSGWPLPSWKAVADRLAGAEHGSSALALISRQGRIGHVLLVYLSSDEGLVPFGFGTVGDVVAGQTVDLPNESPTSTRVMLFDPSGRAITDPFIGFRDSSSTVRAMIDKPLDNRFAGGGLESGPTIPTRPTGGPIIPAAAAAEIAASGQLNGSPVASSRGPGIERTTTVGKPPGDAAGPERHLTPSGAARWDGNGRHGSGERSSTGTHQIQWQPAHSVLPGRHHHLTVTNAGHRRRALQDALVYDPPSGSASLAQVVHASRAYRSASGNAARRSSLIAALPRSAPATIDALARIARNHATTIEDIADAEVYRLLAHALSGRYVPGHKPARIRNLGAVASYEWTTALLSLRSERPQHAAALTDLIVKTLASCI